MRPLSEPEIRASFVNCSKGEAKSLALPRGMESLPWENLDFLGWRDPRATGRGYLVIELAGERPGLVGMSLRAATPPRGRLRSSMCAFCLTVHGRMDVALFSARRAGRAGKNGNTVGTYVCADLDCSLYLRRIRRPEVTPQANETVPVPERVARLEQHVRRFVEDVLASES